jgi:hypothetical protein
MGIPGLSWMNVVIGDPLMRLQVYCTSAIPMNSPLAGSGRKSSCVSCWPRGWWSTDADMPMNPRLIGKPGVGKTTLAYAAAKRHGPRRLHHAGDARYAPRGPSR